MIRSAAVLILVGATILLISGLPESPLTVWSTVPRLVQVTVVCGGMASVAGL